MTGIAAKRLKVVIIILSISFFYIADEHSHQLNGKRETETLLNLPDTFSPERQFCSNFRTKKKFDDAGNDAGLHGRRRLRRLQSDPAVNDHQPGADLMKPTPSMTSGKK